MENKQPLGTFSCSCGMNYSRSGEDKTEEDKLRIGRVIAYGEVWENKLRELVEVKRLGLRATARELRVDTNTIKRYVAKLNLTPSWTKNKPEIQVMLIQKTQHNEKKTLGSGYSKRIQDYQKLRLESLYLTFLGYIVTIESG